MGFFNGFRVGDAAMVSAAALVALGISCSRDSSDSYAVPSKPSDRVVADGSDVYLDALTPTATQTAIPKAAANPWPASVNEPISYASATPLSYADASPVHDVSVDDRVVDAQVSSEAVLSSSVSPTAVVSTVVPTSTPVLLPSVSPTAVVSTVVPTSTPVLLPSVSPTAVVSTVVPTSTPVLLPSVSPTAVVSTVVPTSTPVLSSSVSPTAVVSTVVPTSTPVLSSSVSPTAVVSTVVPTSTPVLLPSVTPVAQKGVKWEVGGKVSLEHRKNIEDAVVLMEDYVKFLGFSGVEGGVSVYVYYDVNGLSSAYERVTGVDKDYAFENHWLNGDRSGLAGEGFVFFNTSVSWYSEDPDYQMHVAVHEFSHAQRYNLSALSLSSEIDEVPEAGPRWLDEGVSEFHAYQALSLGGVVSYDKSRDDHVRNSAFYGSLRGMEAYSGFMSGENSVAYPMLAAELLASLAGQSSLIDFYKALDVGDDWHDEFRKAFGIGVDAYYELFEDHVNAGFPKLEFSK